MIPIWKNVKSKNNNEEKGKSCKNRINGVAKDMPVTSKKNIRKLYYL